MKNPECRKDKRIVKCTRARPDIGQTKRSDDTGILRQMRFIVPNETGGANARIDQEDQEQKHNRAKQTHPPLDNARFTEGHRLIDGVGDALLSTVRSIRTVDENVQAIPPKSLTLANVWLGGVVLPLLSVSWQIIRQTNPGQPVLNPSVISRCHRTWLVEAANSDIDLVSSRSCEKGEWSATIWTERTQASDPWQLSRLSGGEPKVTPAERRPRDERGAATAAAV